MNPEMIIEEMRKDALSRGFKSISEALPIISQEESKLIQEVNQLENQLKTNSILKSEFSE